MKIDSYILNLIDEMHVLMHRIDGYLDAKADLKPQLRFVEDDDPKVIPFPGKQSPLAPTQGDLFPQNEKTPDVGTSDALSEQGFVYFSDKEIQQMPKKIQKLIIVKKKRCHLRVHKSGKDTYTYEIRLRSDGYNLSASGKTIERAKENMINKLCNANHDHSQRSQTPDTFTQFSQYFFENFRENRVAPETYRTDMLRLKNYLIPHFKEIALKKITPFDCKILLEKILNSNKGKTAEEVYSLMSIIFKGAIAHNLIPHNPLNMVQKPIHEKQHGTALNADEENILINAVMNTEFQHSIALCLYCGLRPNELDSAQIEGPFIIAINSKRKNKKVEYKKIPIIDKLKPLLPHDGKFYILPQYKVRAQLRKLFPDHKLYDLRTTFYSRCDELNVAAPARDEFVGHSNGTLTNTYRDLSDEYLLTEGKKLNRW